MNIFISTSTFGNFSSKPLDLLRKKGFKFKLNKKGRKLTNDEIVLALKNCDGVIAGTEKYSAKALEQLPKLKAISRVGIGLDNIDLIKAREKNISVFKTKTSPSKSVAELALALILDCSRYISHQNINLKKKKWIKQTGNLISGKKIGIIGLGAIGKEFVMLTKGFEFEYYAFDVNKDYEFARKNKIKYLSLNKLFKICDIITIHLSYSSKNKNIINQKYLSIMKENLILVNTSRGEIIDENALELSLRRKKLAAVGLDVFKKEPYVGKLLKYDNAILTPHIGSYSKEIRIAMEYESVLNIVNFFKPK